MKRLAGLIVSVAVLMSLAATSPSVGKEAADYSALIAHVLPTVVAIQTKTLVKSKDTGSDLTNASASMRSQVAVGSGFVIDPSGYILTNQHVIKGAYEIIVTLSDQTSLMATLVGTGHLVDIALLKVKPAKPLQSVTFGDAMKLKIGAPVIAIGNPFGLGISVTSGIVSGLDRNIGFSIFDDFIQTDAAINHGNSGGPLFDTDGNVIGVNTAFYDASGTGGGNLGIGYAIPSYVAESVGQMLREYGYPRAGWTGAYVQQVTPDLADALAVKDVTGAIVTHFDSDAPANGVLHLGDIVRKAGIYDVTDPRIFYEVMVKQIGQVTPLEIWREGKVQTVSITPIEWPGMNTKEMTIERPMKNSTTMQMDFGADVAQINDESRRQFSLSADQTGVVITNVKPDSPAATAGLGIGDVIIMAQLKPVRSETDMIDALNDALKNKRGHITGLAKTAKGTKWITFPIKSGE